MKNTTQTALAMVVAMTALDMISEDEELIRRLREHAAKDSTFPLEAGDLNSLVMTMMCNALLDHSRAMLEDEGHGHRLRAGAVIPIPRIEGAARESADALGVASFTTEFVHAAEGEFERFLEWMDKAHPAATDNGSTINRPQIARADQLLTTMAHVADHIASERGDVHVGHDEKGTVSMSERDTWAGFGLDDGRRNV